MNISLQNTDKVSALLTIKLVKQDYEERVEKSLKAFRQKANIPGFRPGKIPMGLLKRQYGKGFVAEEVSKLLQEKIYDYVKENKVDMLGEPLPDENQQPVDFEKQEEFEFVYDIALAPKFDASVSAADKISYYTVEVTDQMVDDQVSMYTQRAGKFEDVEVYEENDLLKGTLTELDEEGKEKEGGIRVEEVTMNPLYMKEDAQKALFKEVKLKDSVVFNPGTAYAGAEMELASLLRIEKEKVAEIKSDFRFDIEGIRRFVAGKLTQEVFDQALGKDVVKTPEEFKTKIREKLVSYYAGESDFRFLIDVRKYLTDRIGKLEYPDALLKRIMLLNNEDKGQAYVDENYDKSIEELTWHLIKEQLVNTNQIKVEADDVRKTAKEATRAQFARYGLLNTPDELLENYAKEMMAKKEEMERLVNVAIENKLAVALKEKATLECKTVSAEEFGKLFA